jgi:hypothetical protein
MMPRSQCRQGRGNWKLATLAGEVQAGTDSWTSFVQHRPVIACAGRGQGSLRNRGEGRHERRAQPVDRHANLERADGRRRASAPRTTADASQTGVRASIVRYWRYFEDLVARGVEIRILHASLPSRPFREELRRLPGLLRPTGAVLFRVAAMSARALQGRDRRWHHDLSRQRELDRGGAWRQRRGSGATFEMGMNSRDDLLLDEVQAYYDRIWRGTECASCKLRDVCPKPLDQ